MPDFDVRLTSNPDSIPWDDRHLSHRNANVMRYRRVQPPTAPALADLVLSCVVGGVVAPLDGALGGRLFTVSRLVWSGPFPFLVTQAAGQSSLITVSFTAAMLGHQELCIRRPGGGSIILSVEAEPVRT